MAYSTQFKNKFIKVYLKNSFSITKSCKIMGITRQTYYDWLKSKNFKKKIEKAENEARDIQIEEAESTHRLMRLGIPIIDNETGKLVGWTERPDTRAIEWYLTKQAEKKYKDEITVKHEGTLADEIKTILKIDDSGKKE